MPHSSIFEQLSIRPGEVDSINTLINNFPYYETPYLLRALEGNNPGDLHRAALMNNNAAWLSVLLREKEQPAPAKPAEKANTAPIPAEPTANPETGIISENGTPPVAEQQITEPVIPVQEVTTTTMEAVNTIAESTPPETMKEETNNPVAPVPPQENPVETLAFEPYHTIDYFASQGIKATKENNPADRFSQQLRSFTEWLKAMKRLPSGEINAPVAIAPQQEVIEMAETSLKKTEVITETMAEVLVKQGRVPEAIAILEKLSLQDKAKSAYFAARIQHLKTI